MVFVFIAILSSLSYQFLSQTQSITNQQALCLGFLKAQRKLINTRHKKIYKASKSLKKTVEIISEKKQPPLRTKQGGYFNLYYLLDPSTEKIAKTCLEAIISRAYGQHESFEKLQNPSFVKDFLALLKDQGTSLQKEAEKISLVNLFPAQEPYKSLYYKMLKGTLIHNNSLDGYPPLEKLFVLKKHNPSKFFSFPQLSYDQLSWIFGEKIRKAIEKKEAEINKTLEAAKTRTLNKSELEEILLQHRYLDSSLLLSHVSFQTTKTVFSSLQGHDPTTQITLIWEDK